MTPRFHRMPFSAEVQSGGGVRFRLWAPAAREVELLLEDAETPERLAMRRQDGGWHELATDRARPGSLYRFMIDGEVPVPDPASRFQPRDVHGPSEVIDPGAFDWQDRDWRGRPWEEAVIYELHVGCFSEAGTFAGVGERLDYLVELGVTAIELMPVADFPGARNWGYDGVYLFAPDSAYGRPEDLKALVQAAHGKGLMVLLDVVYNHFGPEGNYLHRHAPQFFTERHQTPWGAAINFDGDHSRMVRDFYIHNALYWIEEYHLDGLRFDAVHAIIDDSRPHILEDIAAAVRKHITGRPVHLVLENDDNAARFLHRDRMGEPRHYTAQWNDDSHHALHVLLTGETGGYYVDYAKDPAGDLARILAEGFAYQGEASKHRGGEPRGEPSGEVPLTGFVNFMQNHDQIGNRAFGERLHMLAPPRAIEAAAVVLLLAPSPPLIFMGEEWASERPFLFFCDFGEELATLVRDGRRREFAAFPEFADESARERIPDPNDAATFAASRLDWAARETAPQAERLRLYSHLLRLRAREIAPRLPGLGPRAATVTRIGSGGLHLVWRLSDGSRLELLVNLGSEPLGSLPQLQGRMLYASSGTPAAGRLPGWSALVFLQDAGEAA